MRNSRYEKQINWRYSSPVRVSNATSGNTRMSKPTCCDKALTLCCDTLKCNTSWVNISWAGLVLNISSLILNYIIGYNVYKYANWQAQTHSNVRIVGDLVTVSWFGLGIVALPWHKWEEFTCIRDRTCAGCARYTAWMLGMIGTMILYGWLRSKPLFQTSLNTKNMSSEQIGVYVFMFTLLMCIIVYWFFKLCNGEWSEKCCTPSISDKVIFIRMFLIITFIFLVSWIACSSVPGCDYHLHHWWFGYVLVLLTTTSMDNWFDYLLQGVFYAFLLESIFNWTIVFGLFFI